MTLDALMASAHRRLLGLIASILALVLGLATPAAGQTDGSHPRTADLHTGTVELTTASWRGNFDEEIARLLRNDPEARMPALNTVIRVARRDETDTDLSATVAPLIHVAYSDPKLERRLKAVEALQHIGTDGLLASLYRATMERVIGFFGGGSVGNCSSIPRQA